MLGLYEHLVVYLHSSVPGLFYYCDNPSHDNNTVLAFGAEFAVLLCLPALGGAARHALAAEGVALLHLHTVGGQAAGAQPQGLNTRGVNNPISITRLPQSAYIHHTSHRSSHNPS